jgi:hypothetical protein
MVVIDSSAIRQIRHRTVNPSCFITLAKRNLRAAEAVKKGWNDLPVEDREFLKSLAYDLIESPKGVRRLWLKLWAETYMIFIKITGQEEAFYFCLRTLDLLIDNILDAIEREHPYYEQVLSDTLEEVISNLEVGELIDGKGQARKWLQQLSDQALKEI